MAQRHPARANSLGSLTLPRIRLARSSRDVKRLRSPAGLDGLRSKVLMSASTAKEFSRCFIRPPKLAPDMYDGFVTVREDELTMIAGSNGAGKTIAALSLGRNPQEPVIYIVAAEWTTLPSQPTEPDARKQWMSQRDSAAVSYVLEHVVAACGLPPSLVRDAAEGKRVTAAFSSPSELRRLIVVVDDLGVHPDLLCALCSSRSELISHVRPLLHLTETTEVCLVAAGMGLEGYSIAPVSPLARYKLCHLDRCERNGCDVIARLFGFLTDPFDALVSVSNNNNVHRHINNSGIILINPSTSRSEHARARFCCAP